MVIQVQEDAREELAVLEKKTKDLVDELAKRKAAVIEQEKSGGLTGTAAKALVLENKEVCCTSPSKAKVFRTVTVFKSWTKRPRDSTSSTGSRRKP